MIRVPLTRRATATFRAATTEHVSSGMGWYPTAHEIARQLGEQYGVTTEVSAGVIAALSPRNGWGLNVRLAELMLASEGTLDRGCLGRSLLQARGVMTSGDPLAVLSGPKVRAFYQAIVSAGTSDEAVIDRHAWDMLVGQRLTPAPIGKQYAEAADRMKRAADIIGVSTCQMQAVTWVSWRARWWSIGAFGIGATA